LNLIFQKTTHKSLGGCERKEKRGKTLNIGGKVIKKCVVLEEICKERETGTGGGKRFPQKQPTKKAAETKRRKIAEKQKAKDTIRTCGDTGNLKNTNPPGKQIIGEGGRC